MASEFTATVKSSGGDYTSLSGAEAGLQNDLTIATIKVLSISAASSPTLVAGDAVLGQTSAATGVCVLVNAARTQILIKTIAVASFQSGEIVQKVADATKTVTLSDAGDSPIVGIACYAMADTTAVTFDGWTTSATNYIRIYTPASERHDGKYNTSKYRIEITGGSGAAIQVNEGFFRMEGLQVLRSIATDVDWWCLSTGDPLDAGAALYMNNNIFRASITASSRNRLIIFNGLGSSTHTVYFWNNLIYDGVDSGYTQTVLELSDRWTFYLYNNTFQNCAKGVGLDNNSYGSTLPNGKMKNCLFDTINTPATGTFEAGTDYNATTAASMNYTVTGGGNSHDRLSQTFTFVNSGADDFHLTSSDAGAKDFGVDLSADANLAFSDDIDSETRSAPWDIGTDELVSSLITVYDAAADMLQDDPEEAIPY